MKLFLNKVQCYDDDETGSKEGLVYMSSTTTITTAWKMFTHCIIKGICQKSKYKYEIKPQMQTVQSKIR